MSGSMIVMVGASLAGGNKNLNIMSPCWLISTYFLVTIADPDLAHGTVLCF